MTWERFVDLCLERVSPVVGGGVGIALFFFLTREVMAEGAWWLGAVLGSAMIAYLAAYLGRAIASGTLFGALIIWGLVVWGLLALFRGRERLVPYALTAVGISTVSAVLAWAGTAVAKLAVIALPAAFVLLLGAWIAMLLDTCLRRSRFRAVRHLPDLLAAATLGASLIIVFDRDLLTTQPAAGALFPVGVWLSVRIWRAMLGSRRLAVRAGADIVLSLLLGTDLVLLIVWAANLFHLTPAEVKVLRTVFDHAGEATELPWQFWFVLYLTLVAATVVFLIFATHPGGDARWARFLRGVRSVDLSRRLLTGIHIGLLVTVLIAMTAPAALDRSLHGAFKARYRVDLQRRLDAESTQAAYEHIRQRFTRSGTSTLRPVALVAIVVKIHRVSPPRSGSREATVTERHLARYVGQLQAEATSSASTVSLPAHALDTSASQRGNLRERLDRLDDQQRRADARTSRAHKAGELAAVAVAGTLQIPDLGRNEIVQIVREYLGGLVESGRLKDVFAAWARHVPVAESLSPDRVVIPDPIRLRLTAGRAVVRRMLARRGRALTTFRNRQPISNESPIDGAVDLANQVRYFDEGTGPCQGCSRLVRPGERPRAPGERPIEPRIP